MGTECQSGKKQFWRGMVERTAVWLKGPTVCIFYSSKRRKSKEQHKGLCLKGVPLLWGPSVWDTDFIHKQPFRRNSSPFQDIISCDRGVKKMPVRGTGHLCPRIPAASSPLPGSEGLSSEFKKLRTTWHRIHLPFVRCCPGDKMLSVYTFTSPIM